MTKTLVQRYVEDRVHMRLFQQERAIYEVTELLESVIKETGVSRTELAKLLGKSKGWVTQLLDGEANKTIRTVADAFAVLGREFRAYATPIHVSSGPHEYQELKKENKLLKKFIKTQMPEVLASCKNADELLKRLKMLNIQEDEIKW